MPLNLKISEYLRSGCILSAGEDNFWLGWGDVSRSAQPQKAGISIYAPDFFLEDAQPWWSFSSTSKCSRHQLIELLSQDSRVELAQDLQWIQPTIQSFKSAFLDLQERFLNGTLEKG